MENLYRRINYNKIGNFYNPLSIKKEIYYKILVNNIIILLLFITYLNNLWLLNKIEKKLKRYIKFKRKQNITSYYYEKELPKIIEYIKSLRGGNFTNNILYDEIVTPKVSFIASVYNKEKYLNSFISSIQNQNLKDFELIIVDDCSTDKSVEIIKKYENNDKRIKLIKNIQNRGSLYTRYIGLQHAKGEFIIFVDSDDIVLKDGILKSYNYIKKKNLDMIEFNSVYEKNNSNIYINRKFYKYYNIIYQPILTYIFYYNKNSAEGNEYNTALWDKLIKKEIAINAFNYIGKEYMNEKIIIENDVIILFSLFKNSNSFQYIDELGYYYFFTNNDSITSKKYNPSYANRIIHSIFCNVKFLYEKTGNTFFEKYICVYKLKQGYIRYRLSFNYLNTGFEFIKNVIIRLLESNYILLKDKIKIKNLTKKIFKNKNLNLYNDFYF